MKKTRFLALLLSIGLAACSSEDIDDNQINVVADPGDESGTTTTTTEINDFIWKGMNLWYYWQEGVEQLADTVDDNQSDYINYLSSIVDPEDFFDSLNHPDDRFSWIDPDYENEDSFLEFSFQWNEVYCIMLCRL